MLSLILVKHSCICLSQNGVIKTSSLRVVGENISFTSETHLHLGPEVFE